MLNFRGVTISLAWTGIFIIALSFSGIVRGQMPGTMPVSLRLDLTQRLRVFLELKQYLQSVNHDLLQWRYVDLNADARGDLLVIVKASDGDSCALWVLSWNDELSSWVQVWNYSSSSLCDVGARLVAYSDGKVLVCETWSVDSWRIKTCSTIVFSQAWRARLEQERTETRDKRVKTRVLQNYDFETQTAQRSYFVIPQNVQMPFLHKQNVYALVMSRWRGNNTPQVDGIRENLEWDGVEANSFNILLHKYLGDGIDDAVDDFDLSSRIELQSSFEVQSVWNRHGLWLGVQVRDLSLVEAKNSCQSPLVLQDSDHIVFWFDRNPSQRRETRIPETWENNYVLAYEENPYRHEMDADVFAIAAMLGDDACKQFLHPSENHWPGGVEIKASQTQGGYFVEAFFPAEIFGVSDLRQWNKHGQGIGFSILQFDKSLEQSARHRQNASSQWRWGDPYSLGELILLPESSQSLPEFPLRWDLWLNPKNKGQSK